MSQSDQEIAADITKTVCNVWLDKRYPENAGDVGKAVADIYQLVFDVVKKSGEP